MASRPTLIIGEEEFLAEQILSGLIGQALSPDDQRLNLDVLDGATPVGEILTRLDTAPFFGPRRVVVVRRLEAMRDSDHEPLVAYLERGDSPTTAIFVARDLDRRRRLFLTFKRVAAVIEARPLSQRDLPAWVSERFAALGKRAAPEAANTLVALAGGGLRDLDHEVQKVAAFVGDRQRIAPADVEAIVTRAGHASIFNLVDAVGGRDAPAALQALHEILATDEPLHVLFMVVRQYRLILKAHRLAGERPVRGRRAGERSGDGGLAERLGVHPYVARKVAEQARGYRADHFPGIFAALMQADRAIKTGTPARLVLETLFVRLCEPDRLPGGRRRAAARA
jgi:DNA polymerase-3 subunit delta